MNLDNLSLQKISDSTSSFGICSLPALPARGAFSADGIQTQSFPVGFWPQSAVRHPHNVAIWQRHGWSTPAPTDDVGLWPRRMLTVFDFSKEAPEEFSLTIESSTQRFARGAEYSGEGATGWKVATTEEAFIERKDETCAHTCTDVNARLKLEFGNRECNLQCGWRASDGSTRVWQWINAQRLWCGSLVEAWQIGGAIYAGESQARLTNEQAARWAETPQAAEQMISAQVYLLLFANGTVDCRVHFVNGELYGRGGFVAGKPLIAFESSQEFSCAKNDDWNLQTHFQKPFGGDDESALTREEGRTIWQPFRDTQQVLGRRNEGEDLVFVPGSENGFPRGVARTAHFGLTLGAAKLPARYLPSPEHSQLAGEWGIALDPDTKTPDGFEALPELAQTARRVFLRNALQEGFCTGGTFRYLDHYPNKRWEFSCDGNETASLFRGAYAMQDRALYDLALANADYNADLNCDHTQFTWHYHEAQPHREIFSLIYMRFAGLVQAHLETGDPYYLNTAEAVANRWISTHRANWPRRGIGRDSEPVEGVLALYDFTGQEYYLDAARHIARDVVASLYPDGSWTSGAGAGPFWGTNALPGTPWNGAHLLSGLSEFLLRATPEDASWPELIEGGTRLLHHTLAMLAGPEYSGFHRTSLAYAWRRHFALAQFSGDEELQAGVLRALQTALQRFEDEGEAYFLNGHHCAGYLDHVWFFKAANLVL
jgi:hypothetical protein